jgi:energy-coupling factor transport system permease protein
MLILTIILMAVSGIPPRHILRGLRPMLFIILLTGILNLFFTKGTPVLPGWIITWEGISQTIKMMLRITMLIIGTFLLTYTTSPMQITDGLEYLLSPLKRLHVPVHELTLIMSMALRFIPTLIEETDKIMSAQKSRGADFETGGLVQRAKALIPVLVPLFVSSFRRADELAVAMECRCYHGGEGRTRMKQLKMTSADITALILGAVFLAAVIVIRRLGF